MESESIGALIEREVVSWPHVTVQPHRFGGVEFQVNQHEIGHLHGDQQADLPFPIRVRRELVAAGRASLHHILPDTGWVSYYMHDEADLASAIELFRLNYDRLAGRISGASAEQGAPAGQEDAYDQIEEDSFPASDPPPGPVTLL